MQKEIAKIDLYNFYESPLSEDLNSSFEDGYFSIHVSEKMSQSTWMLFRETYDTFNKHAIRKWSPRVEILYLNVVTEKIDSLIVSFYNDATNNEIYALLVPDQNEWKKFNVLFFYNNISEIIPKCAKGDNYFEASDELCSAITKKKLDRFDGLDKFNIDDGYPISISVDPSDYSNIEKIKKYIFVLLNAENASCGSLNEVEIIDTTINVEEIESPYIKEIGFKYKEKTYTVDTAINQIVELDIQSENIDYQDYPYIKYIIDKAYCCFIDYSEEFNNFTKRNDFIELLKLCVDEYPFLEMHFDDENGYVKGDTIENFELVNFNLKEIRIKKHKTVNSEETIVLVDDFILNQKQLIKALNELLKQPSTREITFKEIANKFLDQSLLVSEKKALINELDEAYSKLSAEDIKLFKDHDFLLKAINSQKELINNFDFKKIDELRALINKYRSIDFIDENDKNQCHERIFDIRDELNDFELKEVEDDIKSLLDFINETTIQDEKTENFRKVFIKKSLLKDFSLFPKNVRSAIEDIVKNIKMLPGIELNKYFNNLQLNHPFNVHKIRVKNINPYRICFWYGKDFPDRELNKNDIYIIKFIVPGEHDNGIKELKDEKPLSYVENDFEIFFPQDTNVELPECSEIQYKVSSMSNGPVVIYGCAGSGKTIVSIDQYAKISWNIFNSFAPNKNEIAYITFQNVLKDQAVKQLSAYEIKGNCYTLFEYFSYVANETFKSNQISNEDVFIAWFNRTYSGENLNKFNRKKVVKPLENKMEIGRLAFTYFRGVFKGHVSLLNKKDTYLSLSEFMTSMISEGDYLSKEEMESIYYICLDYQINYANEKQLIDDNEIAVRAYKMLKSGLARRVQYIIIDEVQDLTNLQLFAVTASLKENSRNIFFYGDPHQTINPTIFEDSSITNAIRNELGEDVKPIENGDLKYTYRTNSELKKYLQTLESIRLKWLGSYMDNLARVESKDVLKDNPDSSWASFITDKDLARTAVRKAVSSSDAVVIVPSDEIKLRLISEYKLKDRKDRVFTIYEAKGIEWNKAVLYHMLGSNQKYFLDMISGKGLRSTIHRMCFNKYYVSCTRAVSTFVCIEDETDVAIVRNLLTPLAFISNQNQLDLYLSIINTYEGWMDEGRKLIGAGRRDAARNAFLNALKIPNITPKQKKEISNYLKSNSGEEGDDYNFNEGVRLFVEEKDYEGAASLFVACKKYDFYNLMMIYLDKPIKKEKYFNEFLSSNLLEQYPDAYIHLVNQPLFKDLLLNTINKLNTLK